MIKCSNCGTINEDSASRCSGCGAELKDGRMVSSERVVPNRQGPLPTRIDVDAASSAKATMLDVDHPMPSAETKPLQQFSLFDGRYRLVEIIGKGGFSDVWLAEDTLAGNQQVALKVYRADIAAKGASQFSREFARMLNCNHTNLLTPKHYGIVEGVPYLEMAYCSYGSVEKLVGRISEEEAWKLIRDVASGLSYLHSFLNEEGKPCPLVHQDIKPDNILIDQQGHYVITDFGISTQIRATLVRSTMNVGAAGTSSYMAPERFHGQPQPIKANDIWSLGATLFELIEGVPPMGDGGGSMQREDVRFKFTAQISNDLQRVISDCLAFNPTRRPLADELATYAQKKVQGEQAVMTWKRRKKQRGKKSRWWLWILITLLTLGVVFGGVCLYSQKHPITANQQYKMGKQYYDQEQYTEAVVWFEKAAERGNDMAQYFLGECYLDGNGVEKDNETAFEQYSISAQSDNPLALYRVGLCLYYGRGTEKDTIAAISNFKKCIPGLRDYAEQGDAHAQRLLGLSCEFGWGVEKNPQEAFRWYKTSAEQGLKIAKWNLANCYLEGVGTETNDSIAILLFRELAEVGYPPGESTLGWCYENGRGVEKDMQEAVKWYTMAANQGYATAQGNLADCYFWGKGVEKDYIKAVEWARKSAEQGDARGQFRLACCYTQGCGVARDYSQALYWYTQAAEQGQSSAMNNIGALYYLGHGVVRDYTQANNWYFKAATAGCGQACDNLANNYEYGKGLPVDYEQARYWRRKAKELGNK